MSSLGAHSTDTEIVYIADNHYKCGPNAKIKFQEMETESKAKPRV